MNGMDDSGLLNSHLSYKGYSIIIDYEWRLHSYNYRAEDVPNLNIVPVEVYPVGHDIYLGYIELDPKWGKVKLDKVIEMVDRIDEYSKSHPEEDDFPILY